MKRIPLLFSIIFVLSACDNGILPEGRVVEFGDTKLFVEDDKRIIYIEEENLIRFAFDTQSLQIVSADDVSKDFKASIIIENLHNEKIFSEKENNKLSQCNTELFKNITYSICRSSHKGFVFRNNDTKPISYIRCHLFPPEKPEFQNSRPQCQIYSKYNDDVSYYYSYYYMNYNNFIEIDQGIKNLVNKMVIKG